MRQDLRKIEQMYDTVARKWAQHFTGEHEKKLKDQEILHRFSEEIGKDDPVWDLGCGSGGTSGYLNKLGMKISGLDLSEKMLQQARATYPGILFRKGNVLELVFHNDSIAAIVAFYMIVHFTKEQVKRAFTEIYRVLQPGGLFLFTYHVGEETLYIDEFLGEKVAIDFMLFSTNFISNCLTEIGFEQIETIEREPYPEIEYQSQRAYVFARKSGGQ
jgi:ubiquinone/menaquinone biosynthesis C-methylase UbiE